MAHARVFPIIIGPSWLSPVSDDPRRLFRPNHRNLPLRYPPSREGTHATPLRYVLRLLRSPSSPPHPNPMTWAHAGRSGGSSASGEAARTEAPAAAVLPDRAAPPSPPRRRRAAGGPNKITLGFCTNVQERCVLHAAWAAPTGQPSHSIRFWNLPKC
ncbi:hypothetical protein HU200_043599 [Digitaria exilis]|uniref:Uncharacterized protein n=1 Tax=Digitaria exilis TaxID=1010633 RepID=A0A835B345_9POAL|nr:hypothetical protein HU200_043599 [Digitaria exilis]